ncbi:MAG: hypothetical protein ACTSWN_03545, partial [Promethearchaeota archaeon]
GLSLGINLLGQTKKCTFNCVYCEIGRSGPDEFLDVNFRWDGGDRFDLAAFRKEVMLPLKNLPEIDSATFGYMGETTLATKLDEFLEVTRNIKDELSKTGASFKISIFTNSSTLKNPEIRKVLVKFDFVMAKLDTALESHFLKINRPHASVLGINDIIYDLGLLSKEIKAYPGHQLAIQTLLFRSLNPKIPTNVDSENLAALVDAYNYIEPHIVQVYTIARPPAEAGVHAISTQDKKRIERYIKSKIKSNIEIRIY